MKIFYEKIMVCGGRKFSIIMVWICQNRINWQPLWHISAEIVKLVHACYYKMELYSIHTN